MVCSSSRRWRDDEEVSSKLVGGRPAGKSQRKAGVDGDHIPNRPGVGQVRMKSGRMTGGSGISEKLEPLLIHEEDCHRDIWGCSTAGGSMRHEQRIKRVGKRQNPTDLYACGRRI